MSGLRLAIEVMQRPKQQGKDKHTTPSKATMLQVLFSKHEPQVDTPKRSPNSIISCAFFFSFYASLTSLGVHAG